MQTRDPLALKKAALQKSLEKLQGLAPFPADIVADLKQIISQAKQDDIETINKLRAKLKALLATESKKIFSKATYDSSYAVLLVLARYWPLNTYELDEDKNSPSFGQQVPVGAMNFEKINDQNRVLSSEGYQYNIDELRGFFASTDANNHRHPINRQPIIDRDHDYLCYRADIKSIAINNKHSYVVRGMLYGQRIGFAISFLALFVGAVVLGPKMLLFISSDLVALLYIPLFLGVFLGAAVGYIIDTLNKRLRSVTDPHPQASQLLKEIEETVPLQASTSPQAAADVSVVISSPPEATLSPRDLSSAAQIQQQLLAVSPQTETAAADDDKPKTPEPKPKAQPRIPDARLSWLDRVEIKPKETRVVSLPQTASTP